MATTALDQPCSIEALAGAIPSGRARRYMRAAGYDPVRSGALHAWKEEVGAALFGPLQKAELALRARVGGAFAGRLRPVLVRLARLPGVADHADRRSVADARARLMRAGAPIDAEGLAERASFGLWVGLLRPVYNPPVWSRLLRDAFPHLPASEGRHELAGLASRAAGLRNRVDHHEPLIDLDLSRAHADLARPLAWLDPVLVARGAAATALPRLLRAKP